MGYRCRWLAVKNVELSAALEAVGLRQESASNEAVYDPGLYAVALPGGWLVVIGDGWDFMDMVHEADARGLSKGTESLHFYCDDTSMGASLVAYRDGTRVWTLEHDGSKGRGTSVVSGTPPPIAGEIVARLQERQRESGDKDVDYVYDAAPEIGLALTGFRHDQTLGNGGILPILVLQPK